MLRLLVVDDDPASRVMVKIVLEKRVAQISVEHFGDGREALGFMAEHRVDVLITDLHMPIMSGLALIREVANDYPETSVVVVSGSSGDGTIGEALAAGAYVFVSKPFEVGELVAAVKAAYSSRAKTTGSGVSL